MYIYLFIYCFSMPTAQQRGMGTASSLAQLIDAADDNLKPRQQQLRRVQLCIDLANFGKTLQ